METQVEDFLQFLRFASISTDSAHRESVAACARWLEQKLCAIGLSAELHETPGHPVVVARNTHQPGRRTVLIYGHYDVQPVEPLQLWANPPFEPQIQDGVVTARGATDNKGQILSHIQGVAQSLLKGGDLPVNLIFLIEGEEEIGSPHLASFLQERAEELRCDVVAISDTGMIERGVPTLTYGLRGIVCMEVKLHGPSMDLHSGIYGGAVANPITALARLIATLHDEHGRVAIAGFYDQVKAIESWEHELWAKLPTLQIQALTGVSELFGEAGFSSLERIWARPTAEPNGIGGGYQGEGSKTVIPSEAFAKLTFRLVPGQSPERISALVREHFEKHCPPGVGLEMTEGHRGMPYLMDPHSNHGLAARRALSKAFDTSDVALIREGGSIPIVQTFRDILKVDTLLLGLALPDCRAHSPNENFLLENYFAGMRLNQFLLEELAKA